MSVASRSYVIGLGANLGDRVGTLCAAVEGLATLGKLRGLSPLYETVAVGPPQPDYLNAAALLDSTLAPTPLLAQLLELERQHGRERGERWGPRTLDLDLLFSPGLIVVEPGLALPHPELPRRAFALAPLLDLLPGARDPLSQRPYAESLAALGGSGVQRFETTAAWRAGRAEWR